MIDQKKVNIIITEGLKAATGCEIVKANLAASPIPPYPYISFSIIQSEAINGMYARRDGIRYLPVKQTWSVTVQGDDDDRAFYVAMLAKDWFEECGRVYLNDNGVIAQSVGGIVNRDNLITIGYEYRKGFDVVLTLMNRIEEPELEVIEQINLEGEK